MKSFLGVLLCLVATCLPTWAQETAASFERLAQQASENVDTDPAVAATLFQKALAMRPSWGEGWLYFGGTLYRLERYPEAIQAFDKGILLARPMGTSWAFRGLCEFELKHYDKALEDFLKGEGLGLGNNHAFESVVRQHAAFLYIHADLFDEGMAQLQPLSNYDDHSAGVIEAAGLCALTMPEWPQELSSDKRTIVDLAGKAQWASMSRQPGEAEAAYRELLTRYPQEPGVHYAHGLYLLEADQDAALAEFAEELKGHPGHWPSLVVSASLENKRGESERAMQLARAAAKVVPASYVWLCHAEMGRAYLATHLPGKAVAEFEAAAQQVPNNPQMHFYLEQAYRLAGNEDAARKEKAEFVRLKKLMDPATVAESGGK